MKINKLVFKDEERKLFDFLFDIKSPSTDIIFDIYELSKRNGLDFLFLTQIERSSFDTSLIEKFKNEKFETIARRTQIENFRKIAISEFANIGKPFTVLKGFAVSRVFYDNPIDRGYSDIDILVNKDDFEIFHNYLISSGYVLGVGWNSEPLIKQCSYVKEIGKFRLEIDLHSKISSDFAINKALPNYLFCHESIGFKFKDFTINFPSKNILIIHSFVHLISHINKGNLIKLIWVYDLLKMLQSLDKEEIEILKEKICKLRLSYIYEKTLDFLSLNFSMFDFSIYRIDCNICSSNQELKHLTKNISGFGFLLNNIIYSDSIKEGLVFLLLTIFPPKIVLEKKYNRKFTSRLSLYYFYAYRAFSSIKRYSGQQYEIK